MLFERRFSRDQAAEDHRAAVGAHDVRRDFGQCFVRQREAAVDDDLTLGAVRILSCFPINLSNT
ncbi:MAG: hypothetical protein QM775_05120, partial [Pirellulales bacterium]